MELGVMSNVYRYKRNSNENNSYIEQVRACSEFGFKVVDLNMNSSVKYSVDDLSCDDWQERISALADEAKKLGVRFSQAHAPYNGNFYIYGMRPTDEYTAHFREMTRRTVIAAGMLSIPWITVHPLTDTVNAEYDNSINVRTNTEFYSEFIELAAKNGTGLAFENMNEFKLDKVRRRFGSCADDLCLLVDSIGAENVGVCWDFGHANFGLIKDQPTLLRHVGRRLKATHVHDNLGNRDSHLIPFVGGNIKWEEIMPVFSEIGYKGDFILETHSYMAQIPDALRPAASRLMREFGEYCIALAGQ